MATSCIDLLSDETCRAYVEAREREVYYRSLSHKRPIRDFRDSGFGPIRSFLEMTTSRSIEQKLDRELFQHSLSSFEFIPDYKEPTEELLCRYASWTAPTAYRLLHASAMPNFGALHSRYQVARRENLLEPDDPSWDELNRGFKFLHDVLCIRTLRSNLYYETSGGLLTIAQTSDYSVSLWSLLFDAAVDDWALDEALSLLVERPGGQFPEMFDFFGEHEYRQLIDSLARLASRLVTAGDTDNARLVVAQLQDRVSDTLFSDNSLAIGLTETLAEAHQRVSRGQGDRIVVRTP